MTKHSKSLPKAKAFSWKPYGVSRRWLVMKRRIAPRDDLSFRVLNGYIEQAWIR
jgi:hypothetical protein